ncbi:MAG: glycosyltransferase family 39 protein [Verrucomicrobiota bacterium]|jgi:hypothetical protein|nr:glycosyltransferase family 39 protein [Verrucomicrobiota bacterium]
MNAPLQPLREARRVWFFLAFAAVLALSLYFRAAGLFRGLDQDIVHHPDSSKQVMRLQNYLHENYVVYYDDLFYDGYPYGLNRVDEGLIRLIRAATLPLVRLSVPAVLPPAIPSRHELFYWGRSLRVLYGMLAVLLLYAAARRWGTGRVPALAAAAVYGFAPLGATVAHSVTGDIGVDLFIAFALYFVVRYAVSGRWTWLGAVGLACGMGFSCKFQGLLGIWMAAVPLLLGLWKQVKPLRSFLGGGSATAGGVLLGVLLANPAFFLDPSKTWKYMWKNFAFIQHYGVSGDFLQKPFMERAAFGLSHNVPFIVGCIGIVLMLFGLLALLLAIGAAIGTLRKQSPPKAGEQRRTWVELGITTFPWMALLLATALKPAVQPFHFSFLIPPLALCLAFRLQGAASRRIPCRLLAAILLALVLVEALATSFRESFFWRQMEIKKESARFSKAIFGTAAYGIARHEGRHLIKHFYAEPSTLPVFRNRPSGLKNQQDGWWKRQIQLPVPSIPYPEYTTWMFLNGAVFPRNDRLFLVPATGAGLTPERQDGEGQPLLLPTDSRKGEWVERTLVFDEPPAGVQLGLRTGRHPAKVEVEATGVRRRQVLLPSHEQMVLPLENLTARYSFIARRSGERTVWIATLRIRSQLGPVWATVLTRPEEQAVYHHYGPRPEEAEAFPMPPFDEARVAEEMQTLLYLEEDVPFEVPVDAQPLPGSHIPLAAGAYVWQAHVENKGDHPTRLKLSWGPHDLPFSSQMRHPLLPAGAASNIQWRFEKGFVPYEASLSVSSDHPGLWIHSWALKPDVSALSDWRPEKVRPAEPSIPLDVRYPGLGVIRGVDFIATTDEQGARRFLYAVGVELEDGIAHKTFHETAIFLHIRNEANELLGTLDLSLSDASFSPKAIVWKSNTLDLPPGRYTLSGGLYTPQTRKQIPFAAGTGPRLSDKHHAFLITEFILEAP